MPPRDREAAQDHIGDMIAHLLKLNASPEMIENHRVASETAIQITLADDPDDADAVVRFVAMPDTPIFVGFSSAEHEEKSLPLLQRVANALGYELHDD
jgi:hypothetical protein